MAKLPAGRGKAPSSPRRRRAPAPARRRKTLGARPSKANVEPTQLDKARSFRRRQRASAAARRKPDEPVPRAKGPRGTHRGRESVYAPRSHGPRAKRPV